MPWPGVRTLQRHGRSSLTGVGLLSQSAAWGGPNAGEAQLLCCFQAGNVDMSVAVGSRGACVSCSTPPNPPCVRHEHNSRKPYRALNVGIYQAAGDALWL